MTEKEIVIETIRALPDNCSLAEIAERIELLNSWRRCRNGSINWTEAKAFLTNGIQRAVFLSCRRTASCAQKLLRKQSPRFPPDTKVSTNTFVQ
jgi:hypothetical protein